MQCTLLCRQHRQPFKPHQEILVVLLLLVRALVLVLRVAHH
jgi:hypothetical protein